ncbi:MAG: HDOD domain-containing protein [Thermodesulfobacteriota bacterium]|nr:HDOD domain-containing protein [Thermodesulfobacteriota bacterium]
MEARTVLQRLEKIDDLPTLPTIAMEVNQMLNDYDISIHVLSKTIERDQSITFKILKLVNSAFFGLPSKVSTISHAVILLGFNSVRNAVVSVSVIDTFSQKKALRGFDVTDFWSHSVAVAVTSRYLAESSKTSHPDDCFIGGLLHDMGKLIMAQYFQDLFVKVWNSMQENKISFFDAEKKELPINHAQLGSELARKWNLPQGLIDAIRYHHTISENAADLDLLLAVHAADIVVNHWKLHGDKPLGLTSFHPQARGMMDSLLDSFPEWYPKLNIEIESACKFFIEET